MFTMIGRGARRALGSKLAVAVAAGALGFGVAGTAAYAGIPDDKGVINACYSGTGSLRVIDTADRPPRNKCFGTETALSWTAKGAPGPRGPAGPAGPPGSSNLTFYFKRGIGVVDCNPFDTAVGGGGGFIRVGGSAPPLGSSNPTNFVNGRPISWAAQDINGKALDVSVVCAHQQ
ncbi:MAG: hypothetical protein M3228_01750 [Actinomycetota bacterium]|nr:hypothetical protein [Actinomycetota bacterium]